MIYTYCIYIYTHNYFCVRHLAIITSTVYFSTKDKTYPVCFEKPWPFLSLKNKTFQTSAVEGNIWRGHGQGGSTRSLHYINTKLKQFKIKLHLSLSVFWYFLSILRDVLPSLHYQNSYYLSCTGVRYRHLGVSLHLLSLPGGEEECIKMYSPYYTTAFQQTSNGWQCSQYLN